MDSNIVNRIKECKSTRELRETLEKEGKPVLLGFPILISDDATLKNWAIRQLNIVKCYKQEQESFYTDRMNDINYRIKLLEIALDNPDEFREKYIDKPFPL